MSYGSYGYQDAIEMHIEDVLKRRSLDILNKIKTINVNIYDESVGYAIDYLAIDDIFQ